jgi:pectin methylesterase-like acyl-CoA thioesterase
MKDIKAVYNVEPEIFIDSKYTGVDGNSVNGIKTYKTVQAAINSVSDTNSKEIVMFINAGVYKEKLVIDKPYITLLSKDNKEVTLTYDVSAGTIKRKEHGGDEVTKYGTSGSSSVTILDTGINFKAINITFENRFRAPIEEGNGCQAVALKSDGDKNAFINCRFIGHQDTLYANKGRQYYYKCRIEGDVDFIFGGAQAVFEECTIVSLDRINEIPKGFVAAPSTESNQKFGYLMLNCKLLSNMEGKEIVHLGRPWHPSGAKTSITSNIVYKNCFMDKHITTQGWDQMSGQKPENNIMREYGSTGEGAIISDTRTVLSDEEANEYTKEAVFKDWRI